MAYIIDRQTFAANLNYYRNKQDYTIGKLAEIMMTPINVLRGLETGLVTPSSAQLRRLSEILHLKSEELIMPRPPDIEYQEGC